MIITLVMDQFGETSNGTASTAMRFADVLKKKGHEVRVLTASPISGEGIYVLPERKIPVFNCIIEKNGMKFAVPDKSIITKAVSGSDVVHMLMPFKAQREAYKIAEELHIATTAAFHVQPENITYAIKMGKNKLLNRCMYLRFRRFFNLFSHLHCPSEMLNRLLYKYKYTSCRHVISNGIDPDFTKNTAAVRPREWQKKFVIVMSGRLAREKRQDVLVKAVKLSRHSNDIQLVLCGKGPMEKRLLRACTKLSSPPYIKFCGKSELINILSCADLYVHASDVELEAISCMEAFACGLAPIISDSYNSATKQFAKTERNLFRAGDPYDLAKKIDYYIENPSVLKSDCEQYEKYAGEFKIDACVDKLIEVFLLAVDENKRRWRNVSRENEYLSALDKKSRWEYISKKRRYERDLLRACKKDYCNGYIETVLPQ